MKFEAKMPTVKMISAPNKNGRYAIMAFPTPCKTFNLRTLRASTTNKIIIR